MANDHQIELLQELNDSMSNKYSEYFVFYSKTTSFNINFPQPIKLNANRNYKIGLQYLTTSNYLTTITNQNNKFYYSTDNGKSQNILPIETGSYGLDQISAEINRQMKDNRHAEFSSQDPNTPSKYFFNIKENLSTFKSVIEITNPTYEIDFTKPDTFRKILGFGSKILKKGYNISDETIQITNTSAIMVKCDLVDGGYVNGVKECVLFSFPAMTVPIGYKVNICPPNIIYQNINRKVINSVLFEITNQNMELIDLKGEEICIAVHLKQV
jgi:hypothetical protein